MMTIPQQIVIILLCALGTQIMRFLPFLVFSSDKPTPKYIQYLGKALPSAVFAMLAVYCFKDVSIFSGSHGLPELISVIAIVLVHLWKKNMMLSIAVGTVCYMILIRTIFI